jgi:hypothetical protein
MQAKTGFIQITVGVAGMNLCLLGPFAFWINHHSRHDYVSGDDSLEFLFHQST